jgi:hypothetical protein
MIDCYKVIGRSNIELVLSSSFTVLNYSRLYAYANGLMKPDKIRPADDIPATPRSEMPANGIGSKIDKTRTDPNITSPICEQLPIRHLHGQVTSHHGISPSSPASSP